MGFSSFKSYGYQVAIPKIITAIVNNRPQPFIWLRFDSGDLTNTTTLKNYGSQGTDATLQKIGTGAYPQLSTTGQSVGTGCISLVGQGSTQNGGYVSMSPITTTTNGITFAIWFKFQPDGTMFQFTRLFDFGNAPNTNDLLAYFDDYSNLFSYIGGFGQLVENYNPAFNTGEWFHYAFTIKPNGEWNVYINGTFISTKTIGYPAVKTLNVNDLGKSKFNEPLLTAQLDDFRFYNVPLSSDDVLALYNKTYDKPITGRYFKFQIDAIRGPELNDGVQMSELTLYKDGIRISTTGVSSSEQDPYYDSFYWIEKVFDNNITTKWFSSTELNTILFTYPSDITMNQYSYSTSDTTWRDPVSWKLYYSVDNINWILIDTKINHPITLDRNTTIPLVSVI